MGINENQLTDIYGICDTSAQTYLRNIAFLLRIYNDACPEPTEWTEELLSDLVPDAKPRQVAIQIYNELHAYIATRHALMLDFETYLSEQED